MYKLSIPNATVLIDISYWLRDNNISNADWDLDLGDKFGSTVILFKQEEDFIACRLKFGL